MTQTLWSILRGCTSGDSGPWLDLLLVVAAGTVLIVGLAAVAERFVRPGVWQRTVWQIAMVAVLALLLVEATGMGQGVVRLWRSRTAATEVGPRADVGPVSSAAADRGLSVGGDLLPVPGRIVQEDIPVAMVGDLARPDPFDPGRELRWPPAGDWVPLVAADETAHRREVDVVPHAFIQATVEPAAIPSSPENQIAVAGPAAGTATDTAVRTPADAWPVLPAMAWFPAVWVLGAAAFVGRTLWSRVLLLAFRRRGTRVTDGPLRRRVDRLARRLRIRRRIGVLEAAGLKAPVVFGALRPVVALPATFADEYDPGQQDAVLAHELAHLAAGDPAWQIAADLACAALWWHPLAWWSRRRLRAASEAAADEASLLVPGGPDVLADCLVAMGRRLAHAASAGGLSFAEPGFRSGLGRRVERLLSLRAQRWRAPARGRMGLAKTLLPAALVILTVLTTAWARPRVTPTEGETTMNVLRSSWRHSLAAAMLAWVAADTAPAVAAGQPADESMPPTATAEAVDDYPEQVAFSAEDAEPETPEWQIRERDQRELVETLRRRAEEAEERYRTEAAEMLLAVEAQRLEAEQRQRAALDERLAQVSEQLEILRQSVDAAGETLDERAMDTFAGLIEHATVAVDQLRDPDRRPQQLARHLEAMADLRGALGERLEAIQRELEGARQDEGVRQAQAALRRAQNTANRVVDQTHALAERLGAALQQGVDTIPADLPERELIAQQLEQMQSHIERLQEVGRMEEAEEMSRVQQELIEQFRPRADQPPAPPEELQRRIHHVEVAIDNLHMAGLPEQAEQLTRQLERMRLQLMQRQTRRTTRDADPESPPQPPQTRAVLPTVDTIVPPASSLPRGRRATATLPTLQPRAVVATPDLEQRLQRQQQTVRELGNQMGEVREEMGQLRRMLEELLERDRRL